MRGARLGRERPTAPRSRAGRELELELPHRAVPENGQRHDDANESRIRIAEQVPTTSAVALWITRGSLVVAIVVCSQSES